MLEGPVSVSAGYFFPPSITAHSTAQAKYWGFTPEDDHLGLRQSDTIGNNDAHMYELIARLDMICCGVLMTPLLSADLLASITHSQKNSVRCSRLFSMVLGCIIAKK